MKALAFLAIIILVILLVILLVELLSNGTKRMSLSARQRAQRTGLWRMHEESDDDQVAVYCVEPGTDRKLLVGAPAPFTAPDFDMQLEVLRAEARQKLVTLNDGRKR